MLVRLGPASIQSMEIKARTLYARAFHLSIGVNALDIVVTGTHLLFGRQSVKRCFIEGLFLSSCRGPGERLARPWFSLPI
jgi:cytochrome b subunit of formate dehydrogenase